MIDFNKTVLLVDDTSCMRKIIAHHLLAVGFSNVLTAEDGKDALKVLEEHHEDISLILSDINMPIMNGLTFLKEVKKNGNYNKKKFIFISAETEGAAHHKAKVLGANNFIIKPFTPLALGKIIAKVFAADNTM